MPRLPGCPYVFYNPETRTRWCEGPAFGIAASELGAPMHYIQSVLGHGSVAVIERYYAKYDPKSAAKKLLRLIEEGKVKTGTSGD